MANKYSNFQICTDLKPKEKCIRLRIYSQGKYKNILHEHIPKHRMNQDNAIQLLKTLVIKYSKWSDTNIIYSFLNNRNGQPTTNRSIKINIEYPEPGVIRRYCDNGDVGAWMDEVINPELFREK